MIKDRLARIEEKLDLITDKLNVIDKAVVEQRVVLKEQSNRGDKIEVEMKPLIKHVLMVQGLMKALGIIGITSGIIEGTVILLEYIQKN